MSRYAYRPLMLLLVFIFSGSTLPASSIVAGQRPHSSAPPYNAAPHPAQEVLAAFPNIQVNAESQGTFRATTDIHLGYGINISIHDADRLDWAGELGLDWIKLYGIPGERLPFGVLVRLRGNWADHDDLDGYCGYIQGQATAGLGKVEAYEIGNEPNLDWAWSEGAPGIESPNPAEYTAVLKKAYECIKSVDPDAIVVSGALATVGPYDKNEDPPAYPYAWNDLKFLQAMYDNGAKGYFDALGSHPYGFAFEPEQDPSSLHVNGLAFRRAEQQREMMAANGDGDKQIWATEWGWLLREDSCQSDWLAQGRWWQVVDESTQAEYIQDAFEYAYDSWPWMGPMFLFNLDFSLSGWYDDCDAARYYAIRNPDSTPRQAYNTLRDMPKWPYAIIVPEMVNLLIADEALGVYTRTTCIDNIGSEPLTFTVSADVSWLTVPSGVYTGSGRITLTLDTTGFAIGTVEAPVTVTTNGGLNHVYRPITATVLVVDRVFNVYLPLTTKGFDD